MVTVYVTVAAVLELLLSVCEITAPLPAACPLIEAGADTVHANDDPAMLDDNITSAVLPLQIVCVVGVAVAVGSGFTVIVTVLEVGVLEVRQEAAVYVSVNETVLPVVRDELV